MDTVFHSNFAISTNNMKKSGQQKTTSARK